MLKYPARVAKLVDATDLKSVGVKHRAGSTPAPGTINTPIPTSPDFPNRFRITFKLSEEVGVLYPPS